MANDFADERRAAGPLVISSEPDLLPPDAIHATQVKGLVLDHVFGRAHGA